MVEQLKEIVIDMCKGNMGFQSVRKRITLLPKPFHYIYVNEKKFDDLPDLRASELNFHL